MVKKKFRVVLKIFFHHFVTRTAKNGYFWSQKWPKVAKSDQKSGQNRFFVWGLPTCQTTPNRVYTTSKKSKNTQKKFLVEKKIFPKIVPFDIFREFLVTRNGSKWGQIFAKRRFGFRGFQKSAPPKISLNHPEKNEKMVKKNFGPI